MFLWRYMDYSKYVQLLEQRALYFRAVTKFEDPFEGQYAWGESGNAKFIEVQRKLHLSHGAGMPFDLFMAMNMKTLNDMASHSYASCWHLSGHESEAMWRLYCKTPVEGVLIKTSEELLKKCLTKATEGKITYGPIKYVRNYWIKHYNPEPEVFFRKRLSFEHEKEYRAILQNDPYGSGPPQSGRLVPIDLNELIVEVRSSPMAESNFKSRIAEISQRSGISSPLNDSEIEVQLAMSVEERLLMEGSEGYRQYAIRLVKRYT